MVVNIYFSIYYSNDILPPKHQFTAAKKDRLPHSHNISGGIACRHP